jgi:hypothetical protein
VAGDATVACAHALALLFGSHLPFCPVATLICRLYTCNLTCARSSASRHHDLGGGFGAGSRTSKRGARLVAPLCLAPELEGGGYADALVVGQVAVDGGGVRDGAIKGVE